jgi:predicted RNase H-like HicB family nuclease
MSINPNLYAIIVRPLSEEDGGGFLAFVPDLPHCLGDGATPEEAVADVRSAMIEWAAHTVEIGRDVPLPGTAVEVARQHHEQLLKIIDDQRELLNVQAREIGEAKESVEQLGTKIADVSRRVSALRDRQETPSDADQWSPTVALMAAEGRSLVH